MYVFAKEIARCFFILNSEFCVQVNRRIQVDLKEGQNEVQIKNLPAGIVPSSIRVDSIGKAVIFDVVFSA